MEMKNATLSLLHDNTFVESESSVNNLDNFGNIDNSVLQTINVDLNITILYVLLVSFLSN